MAKKKTDFLIWLEHPWKDLLHIYIYIYEEPLDYEWVRERDQNVLSMSYIL